MDRIWFLTWSTYGSRLPGDARGFVSNIRHPDGKGTRINEPGVPPAENMPALREYHESRLKGSVIRLGVEHAKDVLPQLHETAAYRDWVLLVASVMADHIHLIVGVIGDPEPTDLLRDFKSYASRRLNAKWAKPQSGTWWTEGGSKRKLAELEDKINGISYVQRQPSPLVTWSDWTRIESELGTWAVLCLRERLCQELQTEGGELSSGERGASAPCCTKPRSR